MKALSIVAAFLGGVTLEQQQVFCLHRKEVKTLVEKSQKCAKKESD